MKVITLGDLTFRKEHFHSANLRIMIPPGGKEPALCLVITLFITGGMKDYGVMNAEPTDTIEQYIDLLRRLRRRLNRGEQSRLLSEKLEELSKVTHKDERPDAGTGKVSVDKMPPVGPAIPQGTQIDPRTGRPYAQQRGPAKP